ncbi:hypothetical protein C0J52_10045 [Blattella germanica]|nr:hypothetical protein C0J52_10045 [Blattella germanica]
MENTKFKLYIEASKIVEKVRDKGGDVKTLTDEIGNNLKIDVVDEMIEDTKILEVNKKFDLEHGLVRVLITELLFGTNYIVGGKNRPTYTVLSYKNQFLAILKRMGISKTNFSGMKKIKDVMPQWVRVNTLKTNVVDVVKHFQSKGWRLVYTLGVPSYRAFLNKASKLAAGEFMRDFHIDELLAFPNNTKFKEDELYLNRSIIIQQKADCLSSWILRPVPGSVTLDMCAAPGLKTSHLAALMGNKGTLYAADRCEKKYPKLTQMIEANGVECAKTFNVDALSLDADSCPGVEYILVDVPCSGRDKAPTLSTRSFQQKLLQHALTKFPSVKKVVYTTTTLNNFENEGTVHKALSAVNANPKYPLFKIDETIMEDNWYNCGSYAYEFGSSCLYALPDADLTENSFVASISRVGDPEVPLEEKDDASVDMESCGAGRSPKKNLKNRKRRSVAQNGTVATKKFAVDGECRSPQKKKSPKAKKTIEANSSGKIPHSIKVPYIYKATSTIVRKVKEERGSLKTLVYNSNKHSNIKGLYALSFKTLEKEDVVNGLIDSSQILVKEKKADPWLVRVLVTELLFGKQSLQGESKPVQVVLSYQDALLAGLEQLGKKATLSSGSSDIQDLVSPS